MHSLIAPTFNVVILLGLMVYYLREPLRQFVYQRHTALADELKRVHAMLRDSQEKFDEFTAKLKAIDVETQAMREQAKQDAQTAKNRLVAEAQKLGSTIVTDARSSANNLCSELKTQLAGELSLQVLDRTEALVKDRLTGDDKTRIRQEFSNQVETAR
jgi:F-type H+-transporting ATPase subunit b